MKCLSMIPKFPSRPLPVVAALALTCFASAFFVGRLGWAWFGAVTVFSLLGVTIPWLMIRSVRVTLVPLPTCVREGESVRCRFEILRRFPWPLRGLQIEINDDSYLVTCGTEISLVARQRGKFPPEAVRIKSSFPFGLYTAFDRVRVHKWTLVWPCELVVPALSGRFASRPSDDPRARISASGDTAGLRDYRRGDTVRQIHWNATARMDRLISRERRESIAPLATISLELVTFAGGATGPTSSLEYAIRAVAGLIRSWSEAGFRVRLETGINSIVVDSPIGVNAALDLLAILTPDKVDPGKVSRLPQDTTVTLSAAEAEIDDSENGVIRFSRGVVTEDESPTRDGPIRTTGQLRAAVRMLGTGRMAHA